MKGYDSFDYCPVCVKHHKDDQVKAVAKNKQIHVMCMDCVRSMPLCPIPPWLIAEAIEIAAYRDKHGQ